MKILVFAWRDIRHPKAGGSERFLHETAKRWAQSGHKVTFLTARKGMKQTLPKRETIDGVDFRRSGGRATVYLRAPLTYLFGANRGTDAIVDVENGIPFFTPLFARRPILGIVNHVHKDVLLTELSFPLNRLAHWLETRFFPFVYRNKQMAVISATTEQDLIKIGFKAGNVRVIYCGVDHDKLNPTGSKALAPTVCYVGRIQPYKRVDAVIRAFEIVKADFSDARLIIAGTGEAADQVAAQAAESCFAADIEFLGEISEKRKASLLSESWIYVTASTVEGWGLVVIEANACGTPAIGCRVPGLMESIVDGATGYLADNPGDLPEKIVSLLEDSALRDEMGEAARKFAAGFDWQNTADAYIAVLEELVKRNA